MFTIETASGATGTFTVKISDSTPVIAAVTQYKKNSGALEIAVETYGKEIVSVKLNNRVLQSGEYAYANGKLTIAESVMNSLVAGEYTLEAGVYQALILALGTGTGDNWWCVVYPPLCFAGQPGDNVIYKSKIKEIIDRWKAGH